MDLKRTQSLKKAQDKYIKVSTRSYTVRYNKTGDADVIEMLDKAGNKNAYIRDLIREDIRKRGGDAKEAAISRKEEKVVTVSYDKKTEKWKAACPGTGLALKSDSFDVLLDKIRRSISGKYTIETKPFVIDKEQRK